MNGFERFDEVVGGFVYGVEVGGNEFDIEGKIEVVPDVEDPDGIIVSTTGVGDGFPSSTFPSSSSFSSSTSFPFFSSFSFLSSLISSPIPNISLNNLFSSFNLVISASLSNAQSALPSVPE